jgi:protein-S-isoprenylcysteine O-methyltransferase Ste14
MARSGMKIVFGEFREKPEVIRKGIFGIVRHPVYLSEILFYLSLLIFRTSLAALAIWIIGIGFFHYISRYEEKLLLQRFGDEYRKYMEDVPMFLPKIKIKRNNEKKCNSRASLPPTSHPKGN